MSSRLFLELVFYARTQIVALTLVTSCARLTALNEGISIKSVIRFSFSLGVLFLTFSLSPAWCQKNSGLELLYGAPADARINLFPVLTIDPGTGGFSNFFNVTAPPPFLCSGGETAMGRRYLYVSVPPGSCQNQYGEIIAYTLDPATGVPSAIQGSPFRFGKDSFPNGMAVAPQSNHLYVADAAGYVRAFALDWQTGVPKHLKGSPFISGTNYQLVVDPSGKFLYASDYAHADVFAFSIDVDGALIPVPGSPFPIHDAGTDSSSYGIVDTGKYVYVALSGSNRVAGFSIDSNTGVLAPVPGSTFATGNGPTFLAWSGKFLYVLNESDADVSGYTIDETSGALTLIPGSPFGTDAQTFAFDHSGKYLYLSGGHGIQGYNVDPKTGALSEGAGSHDNNGAVWLAAVELPGATQ
jgi:6-phosphogluconolactonase (cycloisomerase 2 family)